MHLSLFRNKSKYLKIYLECAKLHKYLNVSHFHNITMHLKQKFPRLCCDAVPLVQFLTTIFRQVLMCESRLCFEKMSEITDNYKFILLSIAKMKFNLKKKRTNWNIYVNGGILLENSFRKHRRRCIRWVCLICCT